MVPRGARLVVLVSDLWGRLHLATICAFRSDAAKQQVTIESHRARELLGSMITPIAHAQIPIRMPGSLQHTQAEVGVL